MLSASSQLKVFVARESVDLRRGHDGLCKLAESVLSGDPYSGHYFVFFGIRLDRIKVLFFGTRAGLLFIISGSREVDFECLPLGPTGRASSSTVLS